MIWKDYLYFTRAERTGIKVLAVLLVMVAFSPAMIELIFPRPAMDFELTGLQKRVSGGRGFSEDEVSAIRQGREMLTGALEKGAAAGHAGGGVTAVGRASPHDSELPAGSPGNEPTAEAIRLTPQPFNPNGLPAEAWEAMGLPAHVVRTIKNYEAAGGSFRYREDLQRIYLMQDAWYEELEAYIELPSVHAGRASGAAERESGGVARASGTAERESGGVARASDTAERESGGVARASDTAERESGGVARASDTAERDKALVNINRADTTELMQLRGIGAVFSRRIIDYREQLGGFVSTGQLLEVFGMDADRLMPIEQDILIDAGAIRKINVNEADYVTLVRHPYIDRQLANAIIAFRDQRGQLDSVAQLRASYLVTDDAYQRIEPYLMVGKP